MTTPHTAGFFGGITDRNAEPLHRWRLLLPEHHCAVSRAFRVIAGGESNGYRRMWRIRLDVVARDAMAARREWAKRTGRDVEQCSVEEVR